jgi:hypothetical protein
MPGDRPTKLVVKQRTPWTVMVFLAACAAFVVGGLNIIPALNPFKTETVDRSQPALLKSIQNLSEYRAATANLQVVVDLERDAKFLPSFVKGEKILFVAAGNVDAVVDFGHPAIRLDGERAVTITLPPARLTEARLDLDRSRVYDRDRGVLDRLESVFEDTPTDDTEVLRRAEDKLQAAAHEDPELRRRAEANTRQMLTWMLQGLGFETVTVRFAAPSAAPAS